MDKYDIQIKIMLKIDEIIGNVAIGLNRQGYPDDVEK